MTDERITVNFTEEEFTKNIVAELIHSDFVKQITEVDPVYIMTIPIIGHEIWENIEKYSRIQTVADKLMNMKED